MKTAYELGKEGISKQADGLHNWLGRFHGWMQGGRGGGLYNKVTQGIKHYMPETLKDNFRNFTPAGLRRNAGSAVARGNAFAEMEDLAKTENRVLSSDERANIYKKHQDLGPEAHGQLFDSLSDEEKARATNRANTYHGAMLGGAGGGLLGALHGLKSGWDEDGLWGATKGLVTGGFGGIGIGAIAGGLGGRFAGDYAREGIKDFRRGSKLTSATRKLRDHKQDFNTATGERFAEGDSTPLSMKPTLEAEVGEQESIGLLNAHKAVRGV